MLLTKSIFSSGTIAEGAPIIPISAQLKYNIDVICEYIIKKIPVPVRDFTSEPRLIGILYCVTYVQHFNVVYEATRCTSIIT